VPDQQIQDDRVNPELSHNALKQPDEDHAAPRGQPDHVVSRVPRKSESMLSAIGYPDVWQSIRTFWIDQREGLTCQWHA
jgi:hypothetical protein